MTPHKLDNPAWSALSERHQEFSIVYDGVLFYQPMYCPFGGLVDVSKAANGISTYVDHVDTFFVIGPQPTLNSDISLVQQMVCDQMMLNSRIALQIKEEIEELISDDQRQALFELVSLVQPGYFRQRTADLGRYYGIYKDGQLIAAAGERMQMNGYTEVSAIVTHPDHTRRGYAKQLTKYVADRVFDDNQIPFLHVLASNVHAIKLYEQLGFEFRTKMDFWKLGASR